jgi:hypothetical protein
MEIAAPTENGDHRVEAGKNDPTSETTETTSGYATPPEEQEDERTPIRDSEH